jgi:hypothetical protein
MTDMTPGDTALYDQSAAAIDDDVTDLLESYRDMRAKGDEPTAVMGMAELVLQYMQLPPDHDAHVSVEHLIRVTVGAIKRLAEVSD